MPTYRFLLALCIGLGPLPAQDAAARAQGPAINDLVAELAAREATLESVRLELWTEGSMPGNVRFLTKGTLRVLMAEQQADAAGERRPKVAAVHSRFDYEFADGLKGGMESLKRDDGVETLQDDPTFGQVYVRIDKKVLADLEWAAAALQEEDAPFAEDARASAPLGSAMLRDLSRRYDLVPLSRRESAGQPGIWYGGDQKPRPKAEDGEDADADLDLPIADRVEVFVREGDHAALDVVHLLRGEVIQRITVKKLVLDEPMSAESFRIDAGGRRPIDVKDHPPMQQQIEQLLVRASAKLGGEQPPSRR